MTDRPQSMPSSWLPSLIVTGTVLALVAIFAQFDADPFAEGAAVERGTSVALLLAAGAMLLASRHGGWRGRWHLVALLVMLALREMDFDKAILSEGVLQLRLYSGDAPLAEKLIGAGIVAFAVWLMVRLLRHDLPSWLRGVRSGRPIPLILLAGGIAVVVAKSLDGLARKLQPFGVTLTPETERILVAAEESLELGFALALLVAVLLWWQRDARP